MNLIMKLKLARVFTCSFALALASCNTLHRVVQPTANVSALKFIGEYDIPYNLKYNNTIVGGLSGIDYDAKNNRYFMISDDRSDKNPARFYTATISFTER